MGMLMISISPAWSISALQHALGVLHAAVDQEKTISAADLVQVIDQHLRNAFPSVEEQIINGGRGITACPRCGHGHLVTCRHTSALVGAPVLTCSKHCGYSRIVGEV